VAVIVYLKLPGIMSDLRQYLKNDNNSLSRTFAPMDNAGHAKSMFGQVEINEFAQTFDYCMVFPMKKENGVFQQSPVAKYCVQEMVNAGLECFPYLSVQGDEMLVLIRCPVCRNILHHAFIPPLII
jgi:hypothetical protein